MREVHQDLELPEFPVWSERAVYSIVSIFGILMFILGFVAGWFVCYGGS